MIHFTDYQSAGLIPSFLDERDPRGAQEQLNSNYVYGGFIEFEGFTLVEDNEGLYALRYSEDPDTPEVSRGRMRDELVVVFRHSWVAVIQPDNKFTVARMD